MHDAEKEKTDYQKQNQENRQYDGELAVSAVLFIVFLFHSFTVSC